MNVQVGIDGDSELECVSTNSDDDFTFDSESDSVESLGQNLGQPDITKILSAFTPFPRLPIEIRLKIWKCACFFSRNVDIWAKDIGGIACEYTGHVAHYFHSSAPAPSLLHICRESRSEALKHYQLEFGTTFDCKLAGTAPGLTVSTPPRIYFNWAVDRICVFCPDSLLEPSFSSTTHRFWDFFNKCCKMKLRSLAWNFSGCDFPLFEFIERALSLEEVTIVSDARWLDRKQFRPVGDFEFDDLRELELDVLEENVENHLDFMDWDILSSLECYPLNVRYCKIRLPAKPT
jgi:hypothetical protein